MVIIIPRVTPAGSSPPAEDVTADKEACTAVLVDEVPGELSGESLSDDTGGSEDAPGELSCELSGKLVDPDEETEVPDG